MGYQQGKIEGAIACEYRLKHQQNQAHQAYLQQTDGTEHMLSCIKQMK
jgi:hypothetical protein